MIKEFYSHLLSSMDMGKEPYFGLFSTFLTQGFIWPSIGPSVHLLVHHRDQVENCKNAHFRGSHYDCVCASVCGVGEGMNGGCTPLPTCPQWYCDPTSLVILRSISNLSATIFLSDCLAVFMFCRQSIFCQSVCLAYRYGGNLSCQIFVCTGYCTPPGILFNYYLNHQNILILKSETLKHQ